MASSENKSENNSKDKKDNGESTMKRNTAFSNNDDPSKKAKQSNAITPDAKKELEPYNVVLFDDGTGFILNEKEVFWAKVVAMSSKNVMAKITTTRLKQVATTMLKKHKKNTKIKCKIMIKK